MSFFGKVEIRLATPGDLEAILRLDHAIENLPHWAAADYLAAVPGAASGPRRCLFVAESSSEIVGLAVGSVTTIAEECSGELESVGVSPAMQRRGLGRQLCCAVIAWCRSHGAATMDLEVRRHSAGPIALYSKLGFEIAGTRRDYYRRPADDALLMRLDLKRQPLPQTVRPTPGL